MAEKQKKNSSSDPGKKAAKKQKSNNKTLKKEAAKALKQEAAYQLRKRLGVFGIFARILPFKVLLILLLSAGLGTVAVSLIPEGVIPPPADRIHHFLIARRNYLLRQSGLPFSGYEDSFSIETAGSDPIKVYFAPSPNITKALCALIDSAVNSIEVCAFDIKLDAVADALIRAHQKKIKVRVVTETDYLKNKALGRISKAGIPIVSDHRSGLMHNKFLIVDHRYIWTGSFNLTHNGQNKNDNNAILLESPDLAASYGERFEQYWEGNFGRKGKRTASPVSFMGKLSLRHGFSPVDRITRTLLGELATAEKSVDIMAFSFTSSELAEKLYKLHKKGVRIRCLYDYGQSKNKASRDEEMRKKGIQVYYSPNRRGKMHHKVMIIDRYTVISGSFNFSKNAERTNDENILILRSAPLAEIYRREMDRCIRGIKGY